MIRSVHMRSGLAVVLAAGIVALSGCPTTRQTRSVEKSGFLGDYSQLREGGMGEAQLVYIKSGVPWSRYTKALRGGVSKWSDVQNAFDYWSEKLRTRLTELRQGA